MNGLGREVGQSLLLFLFTGASTLLVVGVGLLATRVFA
jgi:hypothetical protein